MSTAPHRSFSPWAAIAIAVVLVICAVRTRAIYVEFYGDGPPYYGRTTNMDKWQSPLFEVALVNALGLVAATLIVYGARRRGRSR